MAKYYFNKEDGSRVYIKEIDFAEGKLTFTDKEEEAYKGRDGYYANATRDLIRRNFGENYPEVSNVSCEAPYY